MVFFVDSTILIRGSNWIIDNKQNIITNTNSATKNKGMLVLEFGRTAKNILKKDCHK